MAPQLLKNGREIVRGLEEKAADNIVDVYKTMGDDFVDIGSFTESVLPGHPRIARRVVFGLVSKGFLQASPDDTMIRKVTQP